MSANETLQLGSQIGRLLRSGDTILLFGELGAGKTALTQGIAVGMEIDQLVTSPTFTVVNEYSLGRVPLFHFDLYRLSGPEELSAIGFDDYLDRNGVMVIEWPERLGRLKPAERLEITIYTHSQNCRKCVITSVGRCYDATLHQLEGIL